MTTRNRLSIRMDKTVFNKLAVSAVRYALGRNSYIPGEICNLIRDNLIILTPETKTTILRDIFSSDLSANLSNYWMKLKYSIYTSIYCDIFTDEVGFVVPDENSFWLFVMSAYRHDKDSNNPMLTASEYKKVLATHDDILSRNWYRNFLINTAEAYGINWIDEVGPINDPEGYAELYNYVLNKYLKFNGSRITRDMVVPELLDDDCQFFEETNNG